MERAASDLGVRWAVPELVVAAIYLAARGRGAATFSTALNSNTLNVVAGLLAPAVVLGLGRPSSEAILITVWYALLTVGVLAVAYRHHGLGRFTGGVIIAAYAGFTGSVLAVGYSITAAGVTAAALGAAAAGLMVVALIRRGEKASPG